MLTKKRLRKILMLYIAALLFLIFFSKTLYHFSLPKVTAVMPTSGKLENTVEGYAQVNFAKTYDIISAHEGQIKALYFSKGEVIDPNETLANLQNTDVEASITELSYTIDKLNNALNALKIDEMAIKTQIDKLQQKETQYKDLELENLELDLKNIDDGIETQTQNLSNIKVLYDAGSLSKLECDKAAQELQKLEMQRQQTLNQIQSHRQQLSEQLDQKKIDLQKTQLQIQDSQLELSKAQQSLTKQQSIEQHQIVNTTSQGEIIEVLKQDGSFIAAGEKVATVGVRDQNFVLEWVCSEADAKFIQQGDSAQITVTQSSQQEVATVQEIKPEGEQLRLRLTVTSSQLNGGEYVKILLSKPSINYDVLVPNEAVVTQGYNHYVWVVRSRQTTLGTEYYTVKTKILIAQKDDSMTAISKGLEYIQPVVTHMSKDLTDGGRVYPID